MTKVGFIGLGEMGKGMAQNLAKKGFELIFKPPRKLTGQAREEFIEEFRRVGKVKAVDTCREVAAASEVIFIVVRDDAQGEEVIWGKDGVLEGVKSGSTIIISSTVSPSLCQRLAEEAGKKGVGVLDAPVSGARTGAAAGTLTLMIGGDENLFRNMEPVLQAVSANRFYLGHIGMGQVGKLGNNMILFSCIAATTEGIAFAAKAGIPVKTFLDFVKVSTGNNWVAQNWDLFTKLKQDRSSTSSIQMAYKDLDLGLAYAKQVDIDLPLVAQLHLIDLWRLPQQGGAEGGK